MIERCRDSFPVAMMYQTLKVSTSGYYQWRSGGPVWADAAHHLLLWAACGRFRLYVLLKI
jgi:hypothetical protein